MHWIIYVFWAVSQFAVLVLLWMIYSTVWYIAYKKDTDHSKEVNDGPVF